MRTTVVSQDSDNIFFNSILLSVLLHIVVFLCFPFIRIDLPDKSPLEIIEIEVTDFRSVIKFQNYDREKRVVSSSRKNREVPTRNAVMESREEQPQREKQEPLVSPTPRIVNEVVVPAPPSKQIQINEQIVKKDIIPEKQMSSFDRIEVATRIPRGLENVLESDLEGERAIREKSSAHARLLVESSLDEKGLENDAVPVPTPLMVQSTEDEKDLAVREESPSSVRRPPGTIEIGPDRISAGVIAKEENLFQIPMPHTGVTPRKQSIPVGVVAPSSGQEVDVEKPELQVYENPVEQNDDRDRKIIYEPRTAMPTWAEKKGIRTRFRARIQVDPQGKVIEVRLLTKTGYAELDNLAIEHIKRILYEQFPRTTTRIIEVDLVTK